MLAHFPIPLIQIGTFTNTFDYMNNHFWANILVYYRAVTIWVVITWYLNLYNVSGKQCIKTIWSVQLTTKIAPNIALGMFSVLKMCSIANISQRFMKKIGNEIKFNNEINKIS